MCDNRGERRKKTFRKAVHNLNVYVKAMGISKEKFLGEEGRFKKDKHIEIKNDYKKTNSEWFGKDNFKHGDKKTYMSMREKETEYNTNELTLHEFSYLFN